MTTTIDRAGRVVIPKAIRERAGLQPGMELNVELQGNRVEISAQAPQGHLIERDGMLYWQSGSVGSAVDVLDLIRQGREQREDEILGGTLDHEDRTGH